MQQDECGGKRGFRNPFPERCSLSGKDTEVVWHSYLYKLGYLASTKHVILGHT